MKKLYVAIFTLIFLIPTCTAQNNSTFESKGYVGTLPNLTRQYAPSEPKTSKPVYEKVQNFNSADQIKPIPRDNPAFVNIILKQDKTSKYVNDINEFIPMLEKIYDSIENDESVQLFNAKVYYFNKNADYLKQKYDEKPEGEFISFKKLMELSTHTKSIALLRSEAIKYNPYLAYSGAGYIYDPNNISQQLEYLKAEVKKTILMLKDAN